MPIPAKLIALLRRRPRRQACNYVFPSPAGNREYHMLDRCKAVATRAGLDAAKFDLKTFRSTYATRTLRAGFDVRTVQHWMGHKSLEMTMPYLVSAKEVRARLDQMSIPGLADEPAPARKPPATELTSDRRKREGQRSPTVRSAGAHDDVSNTAAEQAQHSEVQTSASCLRRTLRRVLPDPFRNVLRTESNRRLDFVVRNHIARDVGIDRLRAD